MIHVYACGYVYVCVKYMITLLYYHKYLYVCIHVYVSYVWLCMYVYVCMIMYVYVYVCVCICVCALNLIISKYYYVTCVTPTWVVLVSSFTLIFASNLSALIVKVILEY